MIIKASPCRVPEMKGTFSPNGTVMADKLDNTHDNTHVSYRVTFPRNMDSSNTEVINSRDPKHSMQ